MQNESKSPLILGICSFEPSKLTLRDAAGTVVSMPTQSLRVLAELAQTSGPLVSRDVTVAAVWPDVAVSGGDMS